MKKIEPLRGVEAFAGEELYTKAIMTSGKSVLKGVSFEANGKKERRGVIGKPLEIDGRLWICGGMGNKIIQETEEEAIHLEWDHAILHEVIPIEAWKEKVERDPDGRLGLKEYKGYAVICPEEKKEYVLTGVRAFLTKTVEPRRKEKIDRNLDKKRNRREPPDLDIVTGQLALQD
jgi:hypothetical protein